LKELEFVAPIIAMNQKISDRIILAEELKLGLSSYVPSTEVLAFLKKAKIQELAIIFPVL
jgi:hypothetical protein